MKKWLLIVGGVVLVPILLLVFSYLIVPLLVIGIILLRQNYSTIKGAVGESRVNRILSNLGSNYTIYHDLYIPNRDRGTTQIDHVVTSPFGIFVIETKHYKGWIFGKEDQRYWTQVIYKRKERLYNPIWQNYGHIQALKNYIGIENSDNINSIIAFSPDSTLKFKDNFRSARVIQFPQLMQVIKERNTYRIGEVNLREINQALSGLMNQDKKEKKKIRKQHVQAIKTNRKIRWQQQQESIKRGICPKCSGNLAIRKGQYGSFYGCSNYPICRYTRKMSV